MEKRADADVTCAISNLRTPREHGNVVLVCYFCQFCIFVFALEKKMKILVKGNIFIVWDWKTELSLMRGDSNGVRLYEGLLGIPPDLEPSPSALFPAAVWIFFLHCFFFFKLSLLDNWCSPPTTTADGKDEDKEQQHSWKKEFWIDKV